LIQPFDPEKLV